METNFKIEPEWPEINYPLPDDPDDEDDEDEENAGGIGEIDLPPLQPPNYPLPPEAPYPQIEEEDYVPPNKMEKKKQKKEFIEPLPCKNCRLNKFKIIGVTSNQYLVIYCEACGLIETLDYFVVPEEEKKPKEKPNQTKAASYFG